MPALDIEKILPSYNLAATAATQAELDDALPAASDADQVAITVSSDGGGTGSAITVFVKATLGAPAAGEIHVKEGGSDSATRNNIKNAINGTSDAAVAVYGDAAAGDSANGIAGLTATNGGGTNTVKLTTIGAGSTASFTLSAVAGAWAPTAATTSGTAEGGTVSFPLSDLGIGSNDLTVAESEDGTGDYRKFLYHVLEKYNEYLATLEAVDSISITSGGTDYAPGDVISISGGGGSGAAATVATVDGGTGAITGITVSPAGSGYTTTPSAVVTTTTSGTGASLAVVLETESPAKMTITTTNLLASSDGVTATKNYTVNFTYSLGVLDVAAE